MDSVRHSLGHNFKSPPHTQKLSISISELPLQSTLPLMRKDGLGHGLEPPEAQWPARPTVGSVQNSCSDKAAVTLQSLAVASIAITKKYRPVFWQFWCSFTFSGI